MNTTIAAYEVILFNEKNVHFRLVFPGTSIAQVRETVMELAPSQKIFNIALIGGVR